MVRLEFILCKFLLLFCVFSVSIISFFFSRMLLHMNFHLFRFFQLLSFFHVWVEILHIFLVILSHACIVVISHARIYGALRGDG